MPGTRKLQGLSNSCLTPVRNARSRSPAASARAGTRCRAGARSSQSKVNRFSDALENVKTCAVWAEGWKEMVDGARRGEEEGVGAAWREGKSAGSNWDSRKREGIDKRML